MAERPSLIAALAVNGAATLAAWAGFFLFLPVLPVPAGAVDPAGRLAYVFAHLAWPAAVTLAMVVGVALARARDRAFNPIADPESQSYRTAQRVLANTVEQMAIFVPGLLALAVGVPDSWLGVVPLAVGFFVAGRLLFWLGYLIHPFLRAPGMALTLNVNLATVGTGILAALA